MMFQVDGHNGADAQRGTENDVTTKGVNRKVQAIFWARFEFSVELAETHGIYLADIAVQPGKGCDNETHKAFVMLEPSLIALNLKHKKLRLENSENLNF